MRAISRRRMLGLLGASALSLAINGCEPESTGISDVFAPASPSDPPARSGWADVQPVDFSARFALFPVANEPNGDLGNVVWPDWIQRAGGDVKRLYEFQIVNGELMKHMPCFCDCGRMSNHKSNRDCYVREVKPDGSVVFDTMAPT